MFILLRLREPQIFFFFFNDTATTEIYTLSLHDALPIYVFQRSAAAHAVEELVVVLDEVGLDAHQEDRHARNDGQVRQEHRQVVDQRGPEPADDLLRGRQIGRAHV